MTTQGRVQSGVPEGGQFAASPRAENADLAPEASAAEPKVNSAYFRGDGMAWVEFDPTPVFDGRYNIMVTSAYTWIANGPRYMIGRGRIIKKDGTVGTRVLEVGGRMVPASARDAMKKLFADKERKKRDDIIAEPAYAKRIRALVELDGITARMERRPAEDSRFPGFESSGWLAHLTNPRTGATMEILQHFPMGRSAINDPAGTIAKESADARIADQYPGLVEYADAYSYDLHDPEEAEAADIAWYEAEGAKNRLRAFLGEDYDSYVHGRR